MLSTRCPIRSYYLFVFFTKFQNKYCKPETNVYRVVEKKLNFVLKNLHFLKPLRFQSVENLTGVKIFDVKICVISGHFPWTNRNGRKNTFR